MRRPLLITIVCSLAPMTLMAQEPASEAPVSDAVPASEAPTPDTASVTASTAEEDGAWAEAVAREEAAPAEGEAAAAEPEGWGWGAVPAVNYNSDDGFGYGAIGNLYWYEKGLSPYKYSLMAQLYMTTKWVHVHRLKFDALEVFDLPLRIWGELQYYATISQNYCGVGNEVTCDSAVAEAEADRLGYQGAARDAFVSKYYQLRFMEPWMGINGRWKLTELPNKLEIMAGWRGSYWYYGDFGEAGAYAGSLYDQHYPDGEDGFASVLQLGLMLDSRDNEPAPTKGYWIEGSVRGAASAASTLPAAPAHSVTSAASRVSSRPSCAGPSSTSAFWARSSTSAASASSTSATSVGTGTTSAAIRQSCSGAPAVVCAWPGTRTSSFASTWPAAPWRPAGPGSTSTSRTSTSRPGLCGRGRGPCSRCTCTFT